MKTNLRKSTIIHLAFFIVIALLLSSCDVISGGCSQEELGENIDILNDQLFKFYDKAKLASNTDQSALSSVISEMQDIRNATEDMENPCVEDLKQPLLRYMDATIELFSVYMVDASNPKVDELLTIANSEMEKYYKISVQMRPGTPQP